MPRLLKNRWGRVVFDAMIRTCRSTPVPFDYVCFRWTRSVSVDTPLDLRAVVCSCKIVVQARVVTGIYTLLSSSWLSSRMRQRGRFISVPCFPRPLSLLSLFFKLAPPSSTCIQFCSVGMTPILLHRFRDSMIEGFITTCLLDQKRKQLCRDVSNVLCLVHVKREMYQ